MKYDSFYMNHIIWFITVKFILLAYILWSELGETSFELGPAFSMQFIIVENFPIFFPVAWIPLLKTKFLIFYSNTGFYLFNTFSFKISLFCFFPKENSSGSRQKAACSFLRVNCFAGDLAFNGTNESANCKDSHFWPRVFSVILLWTRQSLFARRNS